MNFKRVGSLCLAAGMSMAALSGCYSRLTESNYASTVVATFGNTKINFDEINYYAKMSQATYDYYYSAYGSLYAQYYGYTTLEEFYAGDALTDGKSMWDTLKEESMRALWQTYVLNDYAQKNSITLTDEEKEKVAEAVKEYFFTTDTGLLEAAGKDETLINKIYTMNALANKAYEQIVSDIDTTVNEADYRYVEISYISVTPTATTDATTAADGTETTAQTVDAAALADTILAEMKAAKEAGDTDFITTVKNNHAEDAGVSIASSSGVTYGKPAEDAAESLSTYSWNNYKTGDFDVYYYESTNMYYAVYCVTDDNEASKASAIESELSNRETEKFAEKYPAISEASEVFTVKEKVYAQYKYKAIDYKNTSESAAAETTTAAETTAATETTAAETTATETTAAETTAAETTAAETTAADAGSKD
ncbi:MAG: hypothetical protein K6F92_08340 [Lachnospiraceae bacterium]|nr:hypothetical protein [Lachnospiraceae bacterium]